MLNTLIDTLASTIGIRRPCRFNRICKLYANSNENCINNLAESYYPEGTPAGCYRQMLNQSENQIKES